MNLFTHMHSAIDAREREHGRNKTDEKADTLALVTTITKEARPYVVAGSFDG